MGALLKDFKAFALRGNVVDMAVGVIIGASFGKIVSSLVSDIIMPPLGMILGKVDFSSLYLNLDFTKHFDSLAQAQAAGAPVIAYGQFLNTVIDFLIQAFVIFMVIREMNKLLPPAPTPVVRATKVCPYCKTTIDAEATKCPNCTADLPADASVPTPTPAATAQ